LVARVREVRVPRRIAAAVVAGLVVVTLSALVILQLIHSTAAPTRSTAGSLASSSELPNGALDPTTDATGSSTAPVSGSATPEVNGGTGPSGGATGSGQGGSQSPAGGGGGGGAGGGNGGGSGPVTVTAFLTVTQNSATSASADVSGSTVTGGAMISTYQIDWGDGNTQTFSGGGTQQHSYHTSGTYTVRLTVTASTGATGQTSRSFSMNVPPPHLVVTDHPVSGNGLGVTLDLSQTTAGGWQLYYFTITWGDGTPSQKFLISWSGSYIQSYYYKACPVDHLTPYRITVTVTDLWGTTAGPVSIGAALSCLA
jgi:hypothetical protein